MTPAPPPLVDAHAHVFTRDMPLAPGAWTQPDYDYPAEAFLADLDRHGISYGVISAATLFGAYSDYTLEALRAHRRLRATVIVEPGISVDELKQMAEAGVVGVRFAWRRAAELPDLRDAAYRALFSRMADLGLHVELLARATQMPAILPALDEAGVAVVIDHFGGPEADDGVDGPGYAAILRALETGRTWVKLSSAFRIAPALVQACAARLLEAVGPGRLVWGSDTPFVGHEGATDYAAALADFETIAPNPEARRAIGEAAQALYFR